MKIKLPALLAALFLIAGMFLTLLPGAAPVAGSARSTATLTPRPGFIVGGMPGLGTPRAAATSTPPAPFGGRTTVAAKPPRAPAYVPGRLLVKFRQPPTFSASRAGILQTGIASLDGKLAQARVKGARALAAARGQAGQPTRGCVGGRHVHARGRPHLSPGSRSLGRHLPDHCCPGRRSQCRVCRAGLHRPTGGCFGQPASGLPQRSRLWAAMGFEPDPDRGGLAGHDRRSLGGYRRHRLRRQPDPSRPGAQPVGQPRRCQRRRAGLPGRSQRLERADQQRRRPGRLRARHRSRRRGRGGHGQCHRHRWHVRWLPHHADRGYAALGHRQLLRHRGRRGLRHHESRLGHQPVAGRLRRLAGAARRRRTPRWQPT